MNDPLFNTPRAPLYAEVRDAIVARIIKGTWAPGEMLPSETAIGAEFGVSQGTVRKALDDLSQRNLVVRRQGKGTFVAAHTPERALFHFFHLVPDSGVRDLPTQSRVLSCKRRRPDAVEAEALNIAKTDRIIEIQRVRDMEGSPVIIENVLVAAELFSDLDKRTLSDVPNELYQMYEERYGITVHRAVERLKAVEAGTFDAKHLNVKLGSPLLQIERVAETVDGRPIELRISRCRTNDHHYISTIV